MSAGRGCTDGWELTIPFFPFPNHAARGGRPVNHNSFVNTQVITRRRQRGLAQALS